MADLPPLPPRPATAGRELPPRRELPRTATALPARAEPDLAPRASRSESTAARPPAAGAHGRPGKPDPRPMRVVYGAGAVAVVSVIAVGMVQPDYTASAGEPGTAAAANQMADDFGPAETAVALAQNGGARVGRNAVGPAATPRVRVRHRTRYVQLKPGQTAPPGATVIYPDGTPVAGQATPRRTPRPGRSNSPATARPRPSQPPAATHRPPAATPRPPAATPRPTPRPTATSRQSG